MDVKQDISSGVIEKGDGAPQSFYTILKPENQLGAPNMASIVQPVHLSGAALYSEGKKKRGRPRRYGPDGPKQATLSPMPISSSIPLAQDFPGWKQPRARPFQLKAHKVELENLGDCLSCSVGSDFRPHLIKVNAGEDILSKIISISGLDSRAVCVLSASGSVSCVTLRQPSAPGCTLLYECCFRIICLSGSFVPANNRITRGISVTLAGPEGRVLGEGLAGYLIADSPVQVILGTFLLGHRQEHQQRNNAAGPNIPAVSHPLQEGVGDSDASISEGNSDDCDNNHHPNSLSILDIFG